MQELELSILISYLFDLDCSFLFVFFFRQVSSHDYPVIENKIKGIVKEKQPFERLVMTKENLLKMFEVGSIHATDNSIVLGP